MTSVSDSDGMVGVCPFCNQPSADSIQPTALMHSEAKPFPLTCHVQCMRAAWRLLAREADATGLFTPEYASERAIMVTLARDEPVPAEFDCPCTSCVYARRLRRSGASEELIEQIAQFAQSVGLALGDLPSAFIEQLAKTVPEGNQAAERDRRLKAKLSQLADSELNDLLGFKEEGR